MIKGLDYAVISEMNRDSVQEMWQSLIPVYKMPADTDMKDYQNTLHGLYKVKDSLVSFTPDSLFTSGKSYFVRYFQFDSDGSAWELMKGKKRLGQTRYIDVPFKGKRPNVAK